MTDFSDTPEDRPDSWAVREWKEPEECAGCGRPADDCPGCEDRPLLDPDRDDSRDGPPFFPRLDPLSDKVVEDRRSGEERRTRDLIAQCDRRLPGWDRRS